MAKYQYGEINIEDVVNNPEEYIIPECLPACKSLWNKNIETKMTSNYENNYLFVQLKNLSEENINILYELSKIDPRYDFKGGTISIKGKGITADCIQELEDLTKVFVFQDTFGYMDASDFLEEYKKNDGEIFINEYGYIDYKNNPKLENITLEEALKISGKKSLYIPEENRVYNSKFFLEWHKKYLEEKQEKKIM